ncbi:hypothetical protein H7142_00855 [Candidatus Saccharibacteria bacterium]|nr:hypothetical protein [Candidatus Saccharibacteria bacterium]
MQPSVSPHLKYNDISFSDIAQFAALHNYAYQPVVTDTTNEASVYINPRTNSVKYDVLSMNIDGYDCEQFVVEYSPISIVYNNKAPKTGVFTSTRFYMQVFAVRLPFIVENLYVESRTNATLNNIIGWSSVRFAEGETVQLEGDFNDFFRVHTPLKRQELTAFTILAPNIMLRMLTAAGNFDFEFSGNTVYFYKTFAYASENHAPMTRGDFEALHTFGVESAKGMVRAGRPAKIVNPSDYVPMWTLFGGTVATFMRELAAVFAFMIAFVIPLLWPIIAFIIIRWIMKFYRLRQKLKGYAADNGRNPVQNEPDSSIIKS